MERIVIGEVEVRGICPMIARRWRSGMNKRQGERRKNDRCSHAKRLRADTPPQV
jgi:hypothetical protein